MTINYVQKQMVFCEEYSINPNELLLLQVLIQAKEENNLKLLEQYFLLRCCSRGFAIEMLTNLRDSGIIESTCEIPKAGTAFDIEQIRLNPEVIAEYKKLF